MGGRNASRAIEQLEEAVPAFTAVIMGVITAVFGGLLRDIICNEVPMILRDTKPYATCAFIGCWVYIGMDLLEMAPAWRLTGAALTVVGTRLISLRMGWELPR